MPIVDVDKLKSGGQKFVSGFTAGQKMMSILGIAGLAIATMMFTKWSATTDYAPVFSNLSSKDASDVTKALDGMKIPYKLSGGGTTIEVPQADLYKARIDLSAKGLPTNGDGLASINSGGITQSKFQQDVNYQNAIQKELANTIMAINGVRHATVILALPSDDPFVGDTQKTTTASVQVDTGNVQLPMEQVQTIVHLVASGVKNLAPNGITVTDANGTLLYSADQSAAMTSAQSLSRKMQYENQIKTKIDQLLRPVLGAGNYAVSPNATFDPSNSKSVTESFKPVLDAKGNVISSGVSDQGSKLTEKSAGSAANLGGATGGTGPTTNKNFEDHTKTDTPLVDKTRTEKTNGGDILTALTIAVVADPSVVKPAELPGLNTLISNAVGILPNTPGFNTAVQLHTMDKTTQKLAQDNAKAAATPKTAAAPLDIMGIARYAVTFLIVALVLFLAWRSVKKAQAAMGPQRVALDLTALEAGQAQQYAHELQLAAVGSGSGSSTGGGMHELAGSPKAIESSRSLVELEVTELIERQPEEVAQTLRSWLADRRT